MKLIINKYIRQIQEDVQNSNINEMMSKIPIDTDITGLSKDLEILRVSIIAEYDAINLYEQLADEAENSDVRKVLLDIAKEEKVHVGEFESILRKLDPEHKPSEDEGSKEVEETI